MIASGCCFVLPFMGVVHGCRLGCVVAGCLCYALWISVCLCCGDAMLFALCCVSCMCARCCCRRLCLSITFCVLIDTPGVGLLNKSCQPKQPPHLYVVPFSPAALHASGSNGAKLPPLAMSNGTLSTLGSHMSMSFCTASCHFMIKI